MIKTPHFWYRKPAQTPGLAETLLGLLSHVYKAGHSINTALQSPHRAEIPVICIGNVIAGGSGKTPAAIAISMLLQEQKFFENPHFLTRGYGGSEKGPLLVTPQHGVRLAGDESLILSRHAPTVMAKNKRAGAALAVENHADALIMDDGLQNNTLHKNLSFMVIDGGTGFGNHRLLPAGPLREPLKRAFAKTDAFILIGKDMRDATHSLPPDKPLFHAHVKATLPEDFDPAAPHIAFAGLGRPEKFYHLLKHLNVNIAGWHEFPDHHHYSEDELARLQKEAEKKKAHLLTTEKDFMHIKDRKTGIPVICLPIEIIFDDAPGLADFIKNKVGFPDEKTALSH